MNLVKIMERFPDQESCIDDLEEIRWGNKPRCPKCEGPKPETQKRERHR